MKEDPTDPKGYFIVKGIEWVIDNVENILINQVRIYENVGFGKEVFRAEYTSKAGDGYQNQSYVVVRWLNDGQITVEFVKDRYRDKDRTQLRGDWNTDCANYGFVS